MSANKTPDKVALIKARFEKNFKEALKKEVIGFSKVQTLEVEEL